MNTRVLVVALGATAVCWPMAALARAQADASGGRSEPLVLASAAQDAGSASSAMDDADSSRINPADIVVTARRREERLQEVPASVTAFTGDQMRRLGLRDITDISLQTPGFAMQNASRQNEQPFIRGMAVNSVFRQAQNASFFIDGIYVSGVARTISIDDLERVEVVLGPQAVYFGRSTFAGAINYVSRKPVLGQFQVDARTNVGENGLYDLTGGVNVPVTDTLSVRLFGQFHSYDGEYRNRLDGRRLGDEYTQGMSASVRWQPTPNLDFIARIQLTKFEDGHSAVTLQDPRANNNCRPNAAGVFQFYCGQLRNPRESNVALNLNQLFNARGFRNEDQQRYSLLANWTVGDFTLSSITAYNKESQELNSDGDAGPLRPQGGLLQSLFTSEFDDTYQELRLTSPQNLPVRFLVGGSYFRSRRIDNNLLFPIIARSNPREISNDSVFGSVAWSIVPQLTITGEGRLQSDRIRVENTQLRSKFRTFLPRVTVDFKPANDKLFYATYAEGNKPGDFNTAAGTPVANQIVVEERLKNYEVGAKTQWLDRRLTLNLTAYRIDWTNQAYQDTVNQQTATGAPILAPNGQPRTVVVTVNAGQTRVKGLEFDSALQLVPGWTVRAAYSYTDSRFRDFLSRLPITYLGRPDQVGGNQVFNTPKHKVILSTTFERPIREGLNLFGSADYTWRDRQFTDELNTAFVGRLNIVNARLGVSNEKFELFMFGRNLTNSRVPDFATRSLDFNTGLNSYLFTLRPSRQLGLTLSYRYRE